MMVPYFCFNSYQNVKGNTAILLDDLLKITEKYIALDKFSKLELHVNFFSILI